MKTAPDIAPPPPAWAFLPAEPQPVRLVRRLCILFASLALAIQFLNLWGVDGQTQAAWLSLDTGRTLLAAMLIGACAAPVRHAALYYARWLAPIVYFTLLPSWRWVALPLYVIFWIPYLRAMAHFGVHAWFRPASALETAWKRANAA